MKIGPALRLAVVAFLVLSASMTLGGDAGAQSLPDDRAALASLKEAKVAFDITAGEAKKLLTVLEVIDETRESLIRHGVAPRFILAFRGPATVLVQSDPQRIKPEDRETVAKIAAKLRQLRAAEGVERLEQCDIAARLAKVKREDLLPELTVVGNSWISLMAYQAKGYGYIAP